MPVIAPVPVFDVARHHV